MNTFIRRQLQQLQYSVQQALWSLCISPSFCSICGK